MLSFRSALLCTFTLVFGWLLVLSLMFIFDAFNHGLWWNTPIMPINQLSPSTSHRSGPVIRATFVR